MRIVLMVLLGAILGTASSAGITPSYLWSEVELPDGALDGLAARMQTESVPLGMWVDGALAFNGVENAQELEGSSAYAYLDGDLLLVSVEGVSARAILRGEFPKAEVIGLAGDTGLGLPGEFLHLADTLGLLPKYCALEFEQRAVPLKLPRSPEGVRLDSVLWGLVNHPDWLEFSRNHGLEREGLRVRVVAELEGELDEQFEPYVHSSTQRLAELLIPIPYLPELGRDPAVRTVRPPHTPYPAEGR